MMTANIERKMYTGYCRRILILPVYPVDTLLYQGNCQNQQEQGNRYCRSVTHILGSETGIINESGQYLSGSARTAISRYDFKLREHLKM